MRCAAVSRAPPTAWRATPGSQTRRGRGRCARRVPVARWVASPSGPGGSRCALTSAHECDAPSRRPARLKHRSIGGSSASTRDTLHPRLRSHARATTRRATTRTKASSDETDGRETKSDDDNAGDGERSLDGAIFALALPAVASLLLDPVLGVVDTAFVGRIQGEGAAEALGGLAVSTAVFNFSFKLFNFLAEVTGPLVASQIAAAKAEESENRYDDRYENTQRTTRAQAAETVRGAMTVAVVLGVSACVALEFGAENVLRWSGGDGLASSTGVDGSGMMHQAEMYLRVRALSAPAALIGTVAVGAYRGLLDTKTPLLVSGAANAVNLGEFIFASVRAIGMMTSCFIYTVLFAVLDPILIFGLGPVPAFGVAGAAAATTAAEWIAAVVFWKMLVDEGLLPRMGQETKNEAEPTKSSEETLETFDESASPDGITGWFSAMKPLAAGSASQLVRTLILQAVLLRATAEAAGSGAAGSHQICIQVRLFYLLIIVYIGN